MLTVLKLGGSVVTDKSKPYSIRKDVLRRIAGELKPYLELNNKLVIVHGGGSHGHHIVNLYRRKNRIEDEHYYSKVTIIMNELSLKISHYLSIEGIPVVILPTHALFKLNENNELEVYSLNVIVEHLEQNIVPILYGDVVLSKKGFPVLSGDDISWYLACKLRAQKLLFATSVNGIYSGPIGESPIIEQIDCRGKNMDEILNKIYVVRDKSSIDVTGGIINKIVAAKKYGCKNLDVIIFNGLVEDNIRKVLLGEKIPGTKVLL